MIGGYIGSKTSCWYVLQYTLPVYIFGLILGRRYLYIQRCTLARENINVAACRSVLQQVHVSHCCSSASISTILWVQKFVLLIRGVQYTSLQMVMYCVWLTYYIWKIAAKQNWNFLLFRVFILYRSKCNLISRTSSNAYKDIIKNFFCGVQPLQLPNLPAHFCCYSAVLVL